MIIDPASVTNGVRTLRRLSLGQQLLTLLVWAGFFGVVFGLVATQPGDGQAFAVPILALLIGAFMLSFAIMRRPRGGEYQMIVSTAGLRGEFGVRRIYPLLATYICIMFAAVSVNGMLSEPPGSRAVAGWALTALAFLLIYAVVLIRLLRVVVAFRIDAEGRAWMRRRGSGWTPLRLSDYQRAYGRIVSGRGGSTASQVDFLKPIADAKSIHIPLMLVSSKTYRTRVDGMIVSRYFQDAARRSGWRVEQKSRGAWKASATDI